MRRLFLADCAAHGQVLLLMFAAPALLLLVVPDPAGLMTHACLQLASMFCLLVLLRREIDRLPLYLCLPQTRRGYLRGRFIANGVWFALYAAGFVLTGAVSALLHRLPPVMHWQLFLLDAAVWGAVCGVALPVAYGFGAMAAIYVANGAMMGLVWLELTIGRHFLPAELAGRGYSLPLLSALLAGGLTVCAGGYLLCRRILARREW